MPATVSQHSAVKGLFGPDSMVWHVSRETAVLLGGGTRALLMQIAHPRVAAAVSDHSRVASDPIGRLLRTLRAIYSFTFAEEQAAIATIDGIARVHSRVHGATPDGEAYDALDPHLLLWVYATLIDSSLLAYETFVAPLSSAQRERFYAEVRAQGPLWGIPGQVFPDGVDALRAWMAELIASGEVHVTPQARAIVPHILRPPLRTVTIWLLPADLRTQFGYTWGPRRERLMVGTAAASRALVPRLPALVRDLPVARAAQRRCQNDKRGRLGGACGVTSTMTSELASPSPSRRQMSPSR